MALKSALGVADTSAGNSEAKAAGDLSQPLDSSGSISLSQPNATPELSPLMKGMNDMKEMFTNLSQQVNSKLDFVIAELSNIKQDLAETKNTIVGLEASVTDTSDRILSFEKKDLPQMRKLINEKSEELEEKLMLLEIYQRKQNLLIYGVPMKPNEDIYTTSLVIFSKFLGIPREEAMKIPLINAHRLPFTKRASSQQGQAEPGPDPIIFRFVRVG